MFLVGGKQPFGVSDLLSVLLFINIMTIQRFEQQFLTIKRFFSS